MKGRSVDMERLPEPPVQQASARLVCRSAGRGPLIVGGSGESPAGGATSGEVATARPSKTATRRGLLGLGLAFGVVGKAGGQSPAPRFPNQPVRVLVPYPPGGPIDVVARILARPMSDILEQPVVIENRSGGGGTVAMEALTRSRPDGHTILMNAIGSLTLQPQILGQVPYDPARDFKLITAVASVASVLVVRRGMEAESVADLVAASRRRPGGLSFGSPGTGTSNHLLGEMLRQRAGLEFVHVPYRGAAPALNDLVGGQIDISILDLPVVLPQIRQGSFKAIAVLSRERASSLPGVPSVVEAGLDYAAAETILAFMAPAMIPADRVAVLFAATGRALRSAEVSQLLLEQGAAPLGTHPDETTQQARADFLRWADVLRGMPPGRLE